MLDARRPSVEDRDGVIAGRRGRARSPHKGAALTLVVTTACAREAPSVLDPRGPAAREVSSLWWPMLWASVAVFAFVVGMAGWGMWRGRTRTAGDLRRDVPWGNRFVLVSGLGVTTAILVAFFFVSVRSMATLARDGRVTALEVSIIAHDWWWEARYPNGAVTANEIHIPSGRRVRFTLRSADVIHSLWVPQLGPKTDLIPGRTTEMWVQADKPGRYRGQCAEYCGLQHALMRLVVVAEAPDAFADWMENAAQPATVTGNERGAAIFFSNTCAGCHTIRGTTATGGLGPDLTHLATRSTFAAGTYDLDAENLARWIRDPHDLKPGTTMPPAQLTDQQLRDLVAFLLSLGFGDER